MDRRTVLAFLLCGLVFMVWMFAMPRQQDQPARQTEQAREVELAERANGGDEKSREAKTGSEETAPVEGAAKPSVEPKVEPGQPAGKVFEPLETARQEDVEVVTDLYRAVFTNVGGQLKSLRLKKFFEKPTRQITNPDFNGRDPNNRQDWLEIVRPRQELYSLALADLAGNYKFESVPFTKPVVSENADKNGRTVTMEYRAPDGLHVRREFVFTQGQYFIGVQTTIRNEAAEARTVQLKISGAPGIDPADDLNTESQGILATGAPNAASMKSKTAPALLKWNDEKKEFEINQEEVMNASGNVLWAASANAFFVAALIPKEGDGQKVSAEVAPFTTKIEREKAAWQARAVASLTFEKSELPGGAEASYILDFFVGPREYETTEPFKDKGLHKLVTYDSFPVVGTPIAFILKTFQSAMGNWGLSIIALTALVRLLLHPLTKKSQVSMYHMSKLKPLMDKLKQKYKNDRQKINSEMMALYKEHGVNPMAGCLPLLLQMPVLFGLFTVLRNFTDFRHAVFIPGLFVDLSQADHLIKLPFENVAIPLVGSIRYLHVLPILTIMLWIIQQVRTPKPDDPQMAMQRKMMLYMVIFFGLMLYNYQSGLALYMITTTSISIAEQAYIKKHIRQIDEKMDSKKRDRDMAKNKGITVQSSGRRKPR